MILIQFMTERDKEDILQNRLISPEMQSYALLQGEAIDEIVDLSNAKLISTYSRDTNGYFRAKEY